MTPEKIKKQSHDLDKIESDGKKNRRHIQNMCCHNEHGSPDGVVRAVGEGNVPTALRCDLCKKNDIGIAPLSPEEFRKSFKEIETCFDYVKFRTNTETENGDVINKDICNFLDLWDKLSKVYCNMYADRKKKKERDNNNNRQECGYTQFAIGSSSINDR